eukprot:Selendium_serpulae@DN3608_c0_g1_i1.p2
MADTGITLQFEDYIVNQIVGKGGETIKDIQETSGAVVTAATSEGKGVVTIRGTAEQIACAKLKVTTIINAARRPDYTGAAGALLRGEAEALFKERQRLFAEADTAAAAGDNNRAGQLRGQASEANKKMKVAHEEAAKAIFEHNNSSEESRSLTKPRLDFHGLQTAEAERFLNEACQSFQQSASAEVLTIVAGAGHHSGCSGPLIKKMVIRELASRGLNFAEIDTGTFEVNKEK